MLRTPPPVLRLAEARGLTIDRCDKDWGESRLAPDGVGDTLPEVAEMVDAGLLTVGTDAEGYETWALTPKGAQVATQMAMSSGDDAAAMLDKLLDAVGA